MNRQLSRLGIIEYCKKCKNVKYVSGKTLCGLTNEMASFDFECNKFMDKNLKQEKSFWKSWKLPLIMSILGFLRFGLKMLSGKLDILGLIFLVLGIGWLLIALFDNED